MAAVRGGGGVKSELHEDGAFACVRTVRLEMEWGKKKWGRQKKKTTKNPSGSDFSLLTRCI